MRIDDHVREEQYIKCPRCRMALLPGEVNCRCMGVASTPYLPDAPDLDEGGNVERLLDEEARKEKGGFGDAKD